MPHRRPPIAGLLRLVVIGLVLTVLGGTFAVAPRGLAAQDQTYTMDQLSEAPKLANPSKAIEAINEAYPRRLQRDGVGGKVQLRFVVGADGKVDVSSIEVLQAAVEELGEAAKQAAAAIEFVPGKVDGNAVRTMVVFPITFNVS